MTGFWTLGDRGAGDVRLRYHAGNETSWIEFLEKPLDEGKQCSEASGQPVRGAGQRERRCQAERQSCSPRAAAGLPTPLRGIAPAPGGLEKVGVNSQVCTRQPRVPASRGVSKEKPRGPWSEAKHRCLERDAQEWGKLCEVGLFEAGTLLATKIILIGSHTADHGNPSCSPPLSKEKAWRQGRYPQAGDGKGASAEN